MVSHYRMPLLFAVDVNKGQGKSRFLYSYNVIYIMIFTICIQKQLYTFKFSGGELGQHPHNLAQC